ncbi:unnamed protein product [Paramecium pentaurelia]|uniref:UvrD-like helicase ATP-binding domain-containing protein n=1 Tax=Paramecium pentaurelia TaxID=43138 RepID=A0A8S1S100_9CILI|nr:unnamed protein product [Paramecium pentaurelia]
MNKVQNNQNRQANSIKQIVKANQRTIQEELNQILEQNRQILQNTSSNEFLKLWFELNAEERSKFILSGYHDLSNFVQQEQKSNLKNFNQILKAVNFFDGVPWHYKITNKFTQNVCSISQHYIKVLAYLKTILQGYFSISNQVMITNVIDIEHLSIFQAYFQTQTEEGFTFFWEVAIDKVPKLICQNKSNIKQIIGFHFYHTITFIDIKFMKILDKDVKLIIQNYHNEIKCSYNRKGIDYQTIQEIQEQYEKEIYKQQLFIKSTHNNNSYWELNYNLKNNDIVKWLSHNFLPIFLNKQEQATYQFDVSSQKWINKIDDYIQQSEENMLFNKDLIQRLADFTSSSSKLVDFLLKIPNFSIKLTDQQQQIIGLEGKIIFTGRSGTGKTTCLILRLLAMKHIFKLRLEMHKRKNPSIQIDSIQFCCLFISNNNILSNQAKNYYKKLNDQVQEELNKNKLKRNYQNSQNIFQTQEVQKNNYRQNLLTQGSLNEIIQQDYPLFLTIQQFIFMIDQCLNKPFFSQNQSQENCSHNYFIASKNIQDMSFQISNQNQKSNLFMKQEIDQESEINFIDLIQQQLNERNNEENKFEKQNLKDELQKQVNDQEIDFPFFLRNFWIKKFSNVDLNPHFVWTYIYSHIKGGSNAHEYPGHYIPKSIFLNMINNNHKEFNILYDIFIQYEKWRIDQGYHDLLDVVNHILIQLKQDQLCIPQIHYLFIDEIQDLPEAIILLFEKIALLGTIYSGDTAQNISQGVGFRFLTIQELSSNNDKVNENHYHQSDQILKTLDQNFRSNSKILNLANSVVSLIQIYFPKTIDILKKESSNFIGNKPIIINGNLDLLFYLFEGLDNSIINQEIQKLPIQLGFSSVIIVKNQESKKNVPKLLQHILILSINEVKGLEFENVILYNFFSDSNIRESEWKQLQTCEVIDEEMNKQSFLNSFTKEQTIDYYTTYFTGYDDKDGNVLIKRMISYIKYYDEFSYSKSGLCNELKQLYIAITRSRSSLYIFDEKPQARRWIEQIWKNLHLIEIFDQSLFDHQRFQNNIQIKSKIQWNKQGKIMFQKQLYEQAEKCFEFSEDYSYLKKAKGFKLATEGCQLILSFQQASKKYQKLKDKNEKISNLKQQYQAKFIEAAQLFQDTLNLRQAAQCFYFCEQYDQASQIYASLELFQEAGEAAYKSEKYIEAAKYFLKCQDIQNTINSYEKAKEFEQILQILHQQKDKINDFIRKSFLQKYFPFFLKKLTIEIENKQLKNYQQNPEEVLAKKFIMSKIDIDDDRNLNDYSSSKKLNNQSESFSFESIKQFKEQKESIPDFESFYIQQNNLSNFEEDSFIQYELDQYYEYLEEEGFLNINLIEYSIITSQRESILKSDIQCINSNQKSTKIKDSVLKKLFKYIAMFSNEFSIPLLTNFNYQAEQQSNFNKIHIEQLDNPDDQLIDLNSIDQSLIFYVLDVLNQFKNYKLCILICNRYNLYNHLIKYLSKIFISLSPLLQQSFGFNSFNKYNLEFSELLIKKGKVASITFHQIFNMIDSKYLTLKFNQNDLIPTKYLGTDFYTLLILLGYWNKIIYQLDYQHSLSVCSLFMNFKSWKCIFWINVIYSLNNSLQSNNIIDPQQLNQVLIKLQQAKQNLNICLQNKNIQLEDFNFDQPLMKLDIQYAIIYLEQYYEQQIMQLIANYKIPQWLYFRKSTVNYIEKIEINNIQTHHIIFNLSEEFFRSVLTETKLNNQIINQLIQNLEFKNAIVDDLQLFQSVYLILFYCQQILHNKPYQLINRIQDMSCKQYNKLIECLNSIIRIFNTNQDNFQKHRSILIRSILSYFKVRQPDNNNLLHPFINQLIIHKQSIILDEIVKQQDSQDNLFIVDIDLNFVLVPRVLIIQSITKKLYQEIQDLNDLRKMCLDDFNPKHYNSFQDNFEIICDHYNFGIHTQYYKSISQQNKQIQQQRLNLVSDGIQKHQKLLFTKSTIYKNQGLLKLLLKNPYLQCNSEYLSFFINQESLYKLKQQYQNSLDFHSQMIKSIILLNYSNCNEFTYLFINNKILQGYGNQYDKYLDFLKFILYKKWNMIDQATLVFFNYISAAKNEITEEELIYNLIFLFLHNIVGLSLNFKERCLIYISRSYTIYFNHINERKGNTYYSQINIHPIQNQDNLQKIIEQLINISKINPTLNQKKIQQLIYILLINLDEISQEIKQLIYDRFLQIKEKSNEKGLYDQIIILMNKPLQMRVQILQKNENTSLYLKNEELFCIEFEKQIDKNLLQQDSQQWIQLNKKYELLMKQSKSILKAYRVYKQQNMTFNTIPKFSFGEYHFTSNFKVSQFINIINICISIRSKLVQIFYQSKNQEVNVIYKNINQLKQLQEIENEFYNSYLCFESKNISKIEFMQQFSYQMEKCQQIIKEYSLNVCLNEDLIDNKFKIQDTFKKQQKQQSNSKL